MKNRLYFFVLLLAFAFTGTSCGFFSDNFQEKGRNRQVTVVTLPNYAMKPPNSAQSWSLGTSEVILLWDKNLPNQLVVYFDWPW